MLQNIHDKAKGWLAYTVVFLISVPFALFGINSYLGGGDKLIAATVNGEEIPFRDVQNELLQQKQRLSSILGKLPAGFDDKTLKSQALEGLINRILIRQEAENNGYRASDSEVFSIISKTGAFQKDGIFNQQKYEQLLASNRRNKVSYESGLRKDISNRQLFDGITQTSFIPTTQASFYQSLLNQERDFETYTLKLDDYKAQVKPTEEEIKSYYDTHSSQFMSEEKIKIAYVQLKVDDLLQSVSVSPEALQSYYDENAARYADPEQRKVAHILVKAGGDEEKAKKQAEALYQDISSGKTTFEKAATENSDDKIAAEKSGDMGFFARGDRGAEFDKVVFSLQKDQLSKPTKTAFGYELIKVSEIKPEVQKTLEEVRASVEKDYRQEEAEKLFQDQVEKLQTVAFENDGSLDPAAQAVGLEVKTSGWFTRSGGKEGFTALPKVIAESFTNSVLNEGKNSVLIEISDVNVAVIRLDSKEAAKLKPLAEVKDKIKQSIVDTKARELVITKGESLLAKLKSAGNWSVLSENGLNVDAVKTFTAIKRKSSKPSKDVVRKVFATHAPKENSVAYSNTILPVGDYVLIALKSVKDGESKLDDKSKNMFYDALSSRERNAIIKALREEADVVIFPEQTDN
ncbi:MAG: hypothetical protein DSZ29_06430 [Aquificaceae bacterium]|nr:MAG: hypothetical protein DSZ29_06430 [Aquificaceae bacterium]